MTTPAALASTLLQASSKLISAKLADFDLPTPTALPSILDALTRATQSNGGQHAVIVLDACNVLTQWKPTDNVALGSLLAFFVRVARQECTAHVLLVTSESACLDWIQQGEHTCWLLPHTHTLCSGAQCPRFS